MLTYSDPPELAAGIETRNLWRACHTDSFWLVMASEARKEANHGCQHEELQGGGRTPQLSEAGRRRRSLRWRCACWRRRGRGAIARGKQERRNDDAEKSGVRGAVGERPG